jgi:RimJ/RimL family protein N-acetyltransferase
MHPLATAHAGLYCRLYGDPTVMHLIGTPLSREAAMQAFQRALAQTGVPSPRAHYWIARDVSGDCGLLALLQDRGQAGTAETGILLLPIMAGQGYAREALAALVAHAFSDLGVRCIRTRHHHDNHAVVGLMQALGFRPGAATATERRWSLWNENWRFEAAAGFAKQHAPG